MCSSLQKVRHLRTTCETISGEKRDNELSTGHSLRSFRLTIRAGVSLEWWTGEMNCLSKAVVTSPLWVRDLEGNVGSIGRGFGTFAIKGLNYVSRAWRVTFVGAWLNGLGPFLYIRVCKVAADLCIEYMYRVFQHTFFSSNLSTKINSYMKIHVYISDILSQILEFLSKICSVYMMKWCEVS